MRIDNNLKLRSVGNQFMIVDSRDGSADFVNVYKLNSTAARIWEYAQGRDFSVGDLADMLCQDYEIEEDNAIECVSKLVSEWNEHGLLCESI